MERLLVAAQENEETQEKGETRRKAMQVVTSVSRFARAAKNCGPLVEFYKKWNLRLDEGLYAMLYSELFEEEAPNTRNAAFCWAVFMRRVFDNRRFLRDTCHAMELDQSIRLCVMTRFTPRAQFQAFALELLDLIFPRYEITNTEVEDIDSVWCTYSGGLTFGVFNFLPDDAIWIGTKANHAGEGRTVEALAEFCSRRNLRVDMDRLRRTYRDIFHGELPDAPFSADAWAAFLKRVLDENRLIWHRDDNPVFERSVSLCLLPTFPANRKEFAAELVGLLFPNDAPCRVYDEEDAVPGVRDLFRVAFRRRGGGPLFGFCFDARGGSIALGLLV
jgi:hypothetical protein